jgi:hypothetical protein
MTTEIRRRCERCHIGFTASESAAWCAITECPETETREPTERQRQEFTRAERSWWHAQHRFSKEVHG